MLRRFWLQEGIFLLIWGLKYFFFLNTFSRAWTNSDKLVPEGSIRTFAGYPTEVSQRNPHRFIFHMEIPESPAVQSTPRRQQWHIMFLLISLLSFLLALCRKISMLWKLIHSLGNEATEKRPCMAMNYPRSGCQTPLPVLLLPLASALRAHPAPTDWAQCLNDWLHSTCLCSVRTVSNANQITDVKN